MALGADTIKWFTGMALKDPGFMTRLRTEPIQLIGEGPIRGLAASGIYIDDAPLPAIERNWLYVYVSGGENRPVGKLYTGTDRFTNSKRMAVIVMEDDGLNRNQMRMINLEIQPMRRRFDQAKMETAPLKVIQKSLDDDWVPTWADKHKDYDWDQVVFKWNVLVVDPKDWPDLFDLDTFEPV